MCTRMCYLTKSRAKRAVKAVKREAREYHSSKIIAVRPVLCYKCGYWHLTGKIASGALRNIHE